MVARGGGSAAPSASRGRCRCGHLAVHHLAVRPLGGTASYRLDPSGPCELCGEATCPRYVAGGRPTGAGDQP